MIAANACVKKRGHFTVGLVHPNFCRGAGVLKAWNPLFCAPWEPFSLVGYKSTEVMRGYLRRTRRRNGTAAAAVSCGHPPCNLCTCHGLRVVVKRDVLDGLLRTERPLH